MTRALKHITCYELQSTDEIVHSTILKRVNLGCKKLAYIGW